MTPAAWTMLGITWSVILFFTGKFFWKVLTTPPRAETPDAAGDRTEGGRPTVPFKDA